MPETMGTGFGFNIGAEFERLKNRLRIKGDIDASIKSRDRYLSKNRSWDRWMEHYSGNSPIYNKVDLKVEKLGGDRRKKRRLLEQKFELDLHLTRNKKLVRLLN